MLRIQARFLLILFLSFSFVQVIGQDKPKTTLAAGPAQMHTTQTSAIVWIMLKDAENATIWLENKGHYQEKQLTFGPDDGDKGFIPFKVEFTGLKPGREYVLGLKADGETIGTGFSVKTFSDKAGGEWSFIIGSCALQTKGIFRPFVGKNQIFKTMEETKCKFNLWLGDNSYYLPSEWSNPKLMYRRQIRQRWVPEINDLIRKMPNYAIWDDHDFGPNDCFGDLKIKEQSLEIIKDFWGNPYYGTENDPGNYCHFRFRQAEFFLLDNRYYRCRPGADSSMLGAGQLGWLKTRLKESTAVFKFIASGSQVINRLNNNEAWALYGEELKLLKSFIREEKITGVIFLTGDRHFTELLVDELDVAYPLYDYTSSPLTSWPTTYNLMGNEKDNPMRINGTLFNDQNFGRITIKGEGEKAEAILEAIDERGDKIWSYTIRASKLR